MRTRPDNLRQQHGITLIECLVYLGVLTVLLSVSGVALAKAWDGHRALRRNANDIQRAVAAGERWRSEVRSANSVTLLDANGEQLLRITTPEGIVEYRHTDGVLLRRAGTDGAWLEVLPRVKDSSMALLSSSPAPMWRWELEMQAAHKRARLRPLFTFTAATRENKQ